MRPRACRPDRIYHLKAPLPRYHGERAVLLGDAAHALTPDIGQRGCLALEDAVSLADALSLEPDMAGALARYDAERRPRTQRAARISALWGSVAEWRNPVAAVLRNTLTRLTPAAVFLRASDDTLSWRPRSPSPVQRDRESAASR